MTEQLCPVCSCTFTGEGYEKDGIHYCCEPCAEGSTSACECGCCKAVEESAEK